MNVLALDGALGAFSAAVACDGVVAAARTQAGSAALERGLSAVDSVLEATRLRPDKLDRLAVGIGPGRFTGLRIAIAYAKSHRGRLEATAGSDFVVRSARVRRVIRARLDGRGGATGRHLGSLPRRFADASCIGADRRGARRPSTAALGGFAGDDTLRRRLLDVVGAPEDVLHALAERGIIVRSFDPAVTPAAAAAALAASSRTPPKSVHEVRADYGELPAAKPPRF